MVLKNNKIVILTTFLVVIFLFALMNTQAFATTVNTQIKILVNGNPLSSDVDPIIENSRVLLPFRACAEALGADVVWVQQDNSVIMTKDATTVKLYIGTNKASIDGKMQILDVNSQVKNNRTLVPLRFVGEALSCDVDWIADSKTVKITSGQNDDVTEYTNPLSENVINSYRSEILNAVNNYRMSKGIGIVSLSTEYNSLAQAHSEDMAKYKYLGSDSIHNGTLEERADKMGLYVPSENVAYIKIPVESENIVDEQYLINQSVNAVTEILAGWKSDYLTNAVVLQPTAAYIGVGVAAIADDSSAIYVTLEVAATKSYFSEKPASTDENGNITLKGYSSLSEGSVTIYKLTDDMQYETSNEYNFQTNEGNFSINISNLDSGNYMAKVSNDSFVFSCGR